MQPTPTASYSLTLRVRLSSRAGSLGELTMAIGRAGGDIGAIDIVTVGNDYIVRDITVSSVSSKHGEQIVEAVRDVDGVELLRLAWVILDQQPRSRESDRTGFWWDQPGRHLRSALLPD
jgi:malate dehydrogenase (oxaloacetate-decarboxylating)